MPAVLRAPSKHTFSACLSPDLSLSPNAHCCCLPPPTLQPVDDIARKKDNPAPQWPVPIELIEWQPVYHQAGAKGEGSRDKLGAIAFAACTTSVWQQTCVCPSGLLMFAFSTPARCPYHSLISPFPCAHIHDSGAVSLHLPHAPISILFLFPLCPQAWGAESGLPTGKSPGPLAVHTSCSA